MSDLWLKLVCWWKGHQWEEAKWLNVIWARYSCKRCFAWTDAIPAPAGQQETRT